MKQCEKCHTQNNDEAAYCKNCGHILEMGKTNQVVKFQKTFSKLNIISIWSFRLSIFTIPLMIVCVTLYNTIYDPLLKGLSAILFVCLIISLTVSVFFQLKYNQRWTKFYMNVDLIIAKEKLTQFAFSQNKSKESVKIRENAKGELKFKDKSLGARGYFHVITDKNGNTLLIGEKYNTQNLIRKVFGKDINFIEK